MLRTEELLEKLNNNPDIEPWFKETLSGLIPQGFEAIAEMISEKKAQETINRTAKIVENCVMHFTDRKEIGIENSEDSGGQKYFTVGTWNGGAIRHEGKNRFSGAFKRIDGTPNFVGELEIDKNITNKAQTLLHEFFGHLVVQIIEPKTVDNKNYAIDGFYMDELSNNGEITRTHNRLIGEGFAELVSEKIANKCGIPYPIAELYKNAYQAAKMLCKATNNKALGFNFDGTPYVLQQNFDKIVGNNSWNIISRALNVDYLLLNNNCPDHSSKEQLDGTQDKLSKYFANVSNFLGLSVDELCNKIKSFEENSFFDNYKMDGKLKQETITRYIKENLGNQYSISEKIKHAAVLLSLYKDIDNINSQKSKNYYLLLTGTLSNQDSKNLLQITNDLIMQKNELLDTSASFSEEIAEQYFNESILVRKSNLGTKFLFLKVENDSINDSAKNYMSGFLGSGEFNLDELECINTTENSNPNHNIIKRKLYGKYSKDNKIKKMFKSRTGRVDEKELPETYVFQPEVSRSIYLISKIGEDEYEIHHMERFNEKSFRKLDMSEPQKVGVNTRKRDLSFVCPNTTKGTKGKRPPSIQQFISKEAVHTK